MINFIPQSECATCGYTWDTGKNGSHLCSHYMIKCSDLEGNIDRLSSREVLLKRIEILERENKLLQDKSLAIKEYETIPEYVEAYLFNGTTPPGFAMMSSALAGDTVTWEFRSPRGTIISNVKHSDYVIVSGGVPNDIIRKDIFENKYRECK